MSCFTWNWFLKSLWPQALVCKPEIGTPQLTGSVVYSSICCNSEDLRGLWQFSRGQPLMISSSKSSPGSPVLCWLPDDPWKTRTVRPWWGRSGPWNNLFHLPKLEFDLPCCHIIFQQWRSTLLFWGHLNKWKRNLFPCRRTQTRPPLVITIKYVRKEQSVEGWLAFCNPAFQVNKSTF